MHTGENFKTCGTVNQHFGARIHLLPVDCHGERNPKLHQPIWRVHQRPVQQNNTDQALARRWLKLQSVAQIGHLRRRVGLQQARRADLHRTIVIHNRNIRAPHPGQARGRMR